MTTSVEAQDSRATSGHLTSRRKRLLAAWWWRWWALWWSEHTEVDEPCTAVEFRVDSLDLPRAVVGGLHDDVASDDLWVLGGLPADGDGVAVVPDVELLEWAR